MKKILIVDDNMDFLRILSSALQKRFQTYESMGVADALKILESVTVDAICSDFNMRDGTGLELLIKNTIMVKTNSMAARIIANPPTAINLPASNFRNGIGIVIMFFNVSSTRSLSMI